MTPIHIPAHVAVSVESTISEEVSMIGHWLFIVPFQYSIVAAQFSEEVYHDYDTARDFKYNKPFADYSDDTPFQISIPISTLHVIIRNIC